MSKVSYQGGSGISFTQMNFTQSRSVIMLIHPG